MNKERYFVWKNYEALTELVEGGGPSTATIVEKSITENGTYNASADEADGYNPVVVNVPNTYTDGDEGKVVDNGALVAQTSKNIDSNGTYTTTTNNEVVVAVPNTYVASDEGKVVDNGALVSQTSATYTTNNTYDTTTINSVTVNIATPDFNYSFDTVPLQPNKTPTGWVNKTWNGYSYPDASSGMGQIWTDGTNIYFDGEDLDDPMLIRNMVLDKSTSTWVNKQWNFDLDVDITKLVATEKNVWTDGTNIYYSDHVNAQLVLDKSTSTWYTKTWNGSYTPPSGVGIWSDGTNIYCSDSGNRIQLVLDKSTSTWNVIDSTYPLAYAVAQNNYSGNLLFKFNDTIYYSDYDVAKYFEPSTNTWSTVHFYINSAGGTAINTMAINFWTDGCNVYCSTGDSNNSTYKVCSIPNSKDLILLDITTDISSPQTGQAVWTDGDNIYMSANCTQKQLTYTKSLNQLTLRPTLA